MRRALVLLLLAAAVPARGDWEVKRAPDDPRVTDALLGALLQAPDDPGALRRLVAHGGGKVGLAKLADRCEARARGAPGLACAHLRREAGQNTQALLLYDKLAAAAPADPRPRRAAGLLQVKLGHTDEALALLDAARVATPEGKARGVILDALLPLYPIAKRLPLADRQRMARAAAIELDALRPSDTASRRRVADMLVEMGLPEPALERLDKLLAQAGDPVRRLPLLFRIAEVADAAHRDDQAIDALERALGLLSARDERRREALERVITVERRRDRLPTLAARWSALPEAKRDAALEESLGRVLDELGERDTARPHLERAIKLDPRALGPRRLLIRIYTRAGDDAAAITELRRLVKTSGDDARLQLELAERLFERPDGRAEALAMATAIGKRHRDATTHAALAALYEKWNEPARALEEQTLLTKIEPSDAEHLIALGELYEARGDKALALKTWRRIAPDGATVPSLLRLSDVLAEHDHAGEALALLEKLAHEHPADGAIARRLALVLERLHRDGEALAIHERLLLEGLEHDDAATVREVGARVVEITARTANGSHTLAELTKRATPAKTASQVELTLLLARARLRDRRAFEAEQLLRALGRDATRPVDRARAYEALSELLAAKTSSSTEALTLLVKAAEADPARAALLYGKASERAAALYKDAEALDYAERAVALAPLDAEAHERLGDRLEARDPARALAELDRAIELDGGRDRLRLRAAELALRRGDEDGAAVRYRGLLVRARDDEAIADASRRAVVLHELTGRLGELEREVAPRAADGKAALRQTLIEIDRRYVPLLDARAEAGDAAARTELGRVATHGLAPLLDGVLDGDREERRAAVQLLGQLGARGAAPLLLKLAAGDAARRGADAPPAELRIAAAEAAAWLAGSDDLPLLTRLVTDPEQPIRYAAAVALSRLHDPRAVTLLAGLARDPHDRVAAAACLGLVGAPLAHEVLRAIAERAWDPFRPRTARACAAVIAARVERGSEADTSGAELIAGWASHPGELVPGIARALLAADPSPAVVDRVLLQVLVDPALHAALTADVSSTTLPPRAGGRVDFAAWITAREIAQPVHERARLSSAIVAWFEHAAETSSLALDPALDDLAMPDGLFARTVQRTELVDRLAPLLARLVGTSTHARRAIALASTRPATLSALAAAKPGDRRFALEALAAPDAALADANRASTLTVLVASGLVSGDWRERRAALLCLRRQPEIGRSASSTSIAKTRAALRADPNPFVAELAASLNQ